MQKFPAQCSPERLRMLQKIFDAVWLVEVRTGGRRPTAALRDKIARCVSAHADNEVLDTDEIERSVLATLDAMPEHSLPTFLLMKSRPSPSAA